MKAKIPYKFWLYASNFTIKSMIQQVSYWSWYAYNNPSQEYGSFVHKKQFSKGRGYVYLVQTWLVDMLYDIACMNNFGNKQISRDEALYLIFLYNDYSGKNIDDKYLNNNNIKLYLYGCGGEQIRFQSKDRFFEDFTREKYILDVISQRGYNHNLPNIQEEFRQITGLSSEEYSFLLYLLFSLSEKTNGSIPSVLPKYEDENNSVANTDNINKIIQTYSITLHEIKTSNHKRQTFYSKPIIKLSNGYIVSNPFLLLNTFSSAQLWVMRNYYFKKNSQKFTNAFGTYFEIYVEEILRNCLPHGSYRMIQPSKKEKRADWYLKIGPYDILVEQKSSLSLLGIKQNHPDIEAMRNHINKNWGEAVSQLERTQQAEKLSSPIKIILVYEDYYKCECLDELFEMNKDLKDDGKYWLVTINEFEVLLTLYKNNPVLALTIIKDKDTAETSKSLFGRELKKFYNEHQISPDIYLKQFGIYDSQLNSISKFFK